MTEIKLKFEYKDKDGYKWYSPKHPYTFEIDGLRQTIPTTFLTDIASIPKIFTKWFKRDDKKTATPAVIHDYLVTMRSLSYFEKHWYFLKFMKLYKVGFFKRWTFFIAVYLFYWTR